MQNVVEEIGRKYGDLIYDLCDGFLKDSPHAQAAYRTILKEIARKLKGPHFVEFEREWILSIAVEQLRILFPKQGRHLSAEDQITLDSTPTFEGRMGHFGYFIDRLHFEERMVLFLKDKFDLPYSEIATCMGWPVDSVKLRRTQALRLLESAIWSAS